MSMISDLRLEAPRREFAADERVTMHVKFSITGDLRDAFTEEGWTRAYNRNDVALKIKYGVKVQAGGFRKRVLADVNTYRKASIFWTRNPLLVNPMKDRRIWVQVAKNFRPYIRLSEEEVRQELLDFDEEVSVAASELGAGRHKVTAEAHASWQKHDYTPAQSCRGSSPGIELVIN